MEADKLYNEIVGMLSIIKNDEKRLMAVLHCVEDQIVGSDQNRKENEISPDFKDVICQIADQINKGMICYLNPETMEFEIVEQDTTYDPVNFSELNDDIVDEYDMSYMKWDSYIKFEPPGTTDLIRMMEKYVSQLKDSKVGSKLVSALDDLTPVNSFMNAIQETNCNNDWEEFRRQETINYVNDVLTNKLYQLEIRETI